MATLGQFAAGLAAAASDESRPLVLVSGNEAADADSIVSALLYAYLLHQDAPFVGTTGTSAIPVMKCNREDVKLRSETVLLLELCGVDSSKLIFLDDSCAQSLMDRAQQLVLVDHNKADGPLIPLGGKVVEIIDHHKDMGEHPQVQGDNRAIAFEGDAATAASACTLIYQRFAAHPEASDILSRDNGAAARALLGVILIDSVNLDPSAKKVCDGDIAAASALQLIAPEPGQAQLFAQLDDAKFDQTFWGSLNPAQCLRYDFKSFTTAGKSVGLSSVLCPFNMLMVKSNFVEEVEKYRGQFDLYGVLTMAKANDGTRARQVCLTSKHDSMAAEAAKFLAAYEGGFFQLEELKEVFVPSSVLAFDQKNTAPSRKQVVPACLKYFESLA